MIVILKMNSFFENMKVEKKVNLLVQKINLI